MKRISEYNDITNIAENDVVPIVDVSDTTQATTGSTRKGTIAKIADYLKDRAETLTHKSLTSPDISGGTIDGADISGGTIASDTNVIEVLKKTYPVGCIYISTVGTNPNTLFGFGTWSAFGAGKVMVGLDAGDTSFDTAGETGGEKTHTLTVAEMPVHSHAQYVTSNPGTGGAGIRKDFDTDASGLTAYPQGVKTGNAGSGSAHNNLPPYVVVYFFKRES